MDIWGRWNRQSRRCSYDLCDQGGIIHRGEKAVIGRSKKRTDAGVRTTNLAWHPDCWLAQVNAYLDNLPEEARLPIRGRKPLPSTPETRELRIKLLRKHASLNHRQLQAAYRGDVVAVGNLEVRKQELIPEILKTGPAPRRWHVE